MICSTLASERIAALSIVSDELKPPDGLTFPHLHNGFRQADYF
jgi:hypothetical protein